jgi:hypothetical protein
VCIYLNVLVVVGDRHLKLFSNPSKLSNTFIHLTIFSFFYLRFKKHNYIYILGIFLNKICAQTASRKKKIVHPTVVP